MPSKVEIFFGGLSAAFVIGTLAFASVNGLTGYEIFRVSLFAVGLGLLFVAVDRTELRRDAKRRVLGSRRGSVL